MKYFIKVKFLGACRALLGKFFLSPISINGWDNRILIVYFQAIGDTVAFTSVLKHYRKFFSNEEITLVVRKGIGLEKQLLRYVDQVISIDTARYIKNPWYAIQVNNRFRKIGFATVIEHDHSPAELASKIFATSLGAREVVGYEGFRLPYEKPFNATMRKTVEYIRRNLSPKFTRIIPSLPDNQRPFLRHAIEHYRAMYEAITKRKESDYAPVLIPEASADARVRAFLESYGFKKDAYAVLNLGSSTDWKNWPVERFAAVADVFKRRQLPVVLVGAPGERELGNRFESLYNGKCVNAIGEFDIGGVVALIASSRIVLSNDTSVVHVAVALAKPSVCVVGTGLLGLISCYGYADRNVWVYKDIGCVGDHWQCLARRAGIPAPCIDAVTVEEVSEKLDALLTQSPVSVTPADFKNSFFHD